MSTEFAELADSMKDFSFLSWSSKNTDQYKLKVWERPSHWYANYHKSFPRTVSQQSLLLESKTLKQKEEDRLTLKYQFFFKNQLNLMPLQQT